MMQPAATIDKTVATSAIVQGDAIDLAQRLEPASVDVAVTSPPYWGLRGYGLPHDDSVLSKWRLAGSDECTPSYAWYRDAGGQLGLEPYPEWYVRHLVEIFAALRRSLRPDGSVWVNLGDTYFARWSSIREGGRQGLGGTARRRRVTPTGGYLHDKQLLLIPARFAIAMQEDGWILRNDLIWNKGLVEPRRQGDRLRASHEHFFHFVQRTPSGRPRYYYDAALLEPGALDVVSYSPGKATDGHTATFPPELIRPRILSCSRPGGRVLDPFCGTGTSIVVAVENGRRGIGFELSQRHAETARRRLATALADPQRERPLLTLAPVAKMASERSLRVGPRIVRAFRAMSCLVKTAHEQHRVGEQSGLRHLKK